MAGLLTGVTKPWKQLSTGRWPDQIAYSQQDVHLFSVNPNPTINPLDHVHVFNFDVDTAPPYAMTVQLPVMNQLPGGNRFYFFYVSHCHLNDTLSFAVTTLSGDTINGIAGPVSFTLTGTKILFVCVAVKQNYIIHPINNEILMPGSSNIPTVIFDYNPAATGSIVGPSAACPFAGAEDIYAQNAGFVGEQTIVAGMSGFLVPNQAVPTQLFQGFLCTHTGWYMVQPNFFTQLGYIAPASTTTLGPYQFNMNEYDSTGAYVGATTSSSYVPFNQEPNPLVTHIPWLVDTDFFMLLTAGNYYVPSFSYDNASIGAITDYTISGDVVFVYWAPFIPPPIELEAPSARALPPPAQPAPPNPNEIIMGSKQDTAAARKALHVKQNAAKKASLQQNSASSSSSGHGGFPTVTSAQGNQITLGDIETVFRRLIQQGGGFPQQQPPQPSVPPLVFAPPPSNAAGKKRARGDGEGPSDPRSSKKQ